MHLYFEAFLIGVFFCHQKFNIGPLWFNVALLDIPFLKKPKPICFYWLSHLSHLSHLNTPASTFDIYGLECPKQVYTAWIGNYMSHNTMGCNYLTNTTYLTFVGRVAGCLLRVFRKNILCVITKPHLQVPANCFPFCGVFRDHSVYGPSQWEMALQCNAISHWLGAYTECSLSFQQHIIQHQMAGLMDRKHKKP